MPIGVSTQMHPHVFAQKGNNGMLQVLRDHPYSVLQVNVAHTVKDSRLSVQWFEGGSVRVATFKDPTINEMDGYIQIENYVFWETPMPLLCTGCKACRP